MAKMSASLVQATVRAMIKRKLYPTRAALTLIASAVNKIKQLLKDKLKHTLEYTKSKGDSDEQVIQDGVRVFIEKKVQLTLLGTEMDYAEDKLSSDKVQLEYKLLCEQECIRVARIYESITPTVELNALCMKLGKKPMYKPVDPYSRMQSTYNYNMRGGAYPPRYFYPFPVPPLLYQVELSVGGQQFNGKGKTRQAAKHDAAAKALRILQNEPPPERLERSFAGKKHHHSILIFGVNGRESEEENLNKSEISQVFEIALKRNLPVNFEHPKLTQLQSSIFHPADASLPAVGQRWDGSSQGRLSLSTWVARESGPPHMKNFVTKVSVGEFVGEGEGKSKKISKKNAAIAVLEELKKLPPLPAVERVKPRIKKKTKPIVKEALTTAPVITVGYLAGAPRVSVERMPQTTPEYGQGINPISRLAQIQQAKKEKEPEYMLLTERGLPRRREFVMQVKVGNHTAEGTGTNKKVAKRNAAENMLEILGFKVPQAQPTKPALKSEEKTPIKKPGDGRKVTFFEPGSGDENGTSNKEDEFRMPYLSHQQLPAGILPMVPEVAQAVGVSQGHHTKDFTRAAPNPAKATVTAMIARELLYGGTSPTAETILKNNISSSHVPHGPLTRPSEQLDYLSRVQGFQVEYKDFPKNNKNEFVSLINCSSQPPLISHGIGKDVESCHDMVRHSLGEGLGC
ncbi:Double-stranded RNA-binding protein Staufen 1 [Saguinus oedipus]|uniref:Double-stranded RNA-binding protein Staufen 1 n=1 Tax=Saguinus oedipus TaxID=9490 RepID=A0ABQ9VL52_SAGOE|nr:Double-stranded RNA-binding protein Staufen 1 [Saguinus oedipus]